MIITSCPYRVSFFGGGTDFKEWYSNNGSNIISCSIDAYCYVTIRKLLPFYGNKYRISWSQIEEVNNVSEIKHPAIKGALKYLNIQSGLEIHTDGDLPARSGLGSSSAFSAALLFALYELKGQNITLNQLTKETINFEQQILQENVGVQDQIQTCNGGFNLLSINKSGDYRILRMDISSPLVKKISNNMFLLFTGKTRNSSLIQKSNHAINQELRFKSLEKISKISKKVTDLLTKEDIKFEEFSSFLNETWEQKINLFPDSQNKDKILEIYAKALKAGASSGKLLGAGGGGFFLFFVEDDLQNKFSEDMKKFTIVKHHVTDDPCKKVFNAKI